MFVGHYSAAFAIKRMEPRLPLGLLFLLVQFLDLLFTTLLMVGVEKMRIVPGFTEVNSYDLYHIPFSHGLVATWGWSLAVGLGLGFWFRQRQKGLVDLQSLALWAGLAVFSHWVFDLPMHRPDLPFLGSDSIKWGWGLWQNRNLSVLFELTLLGAGWTFFWTGLKPTQKISSRGLGWGLLLILLVAGLITPFLPPPGSSTEFALQALAAYFVLAIIAHLLDRKIFLGSQ